MEMTNEEICRNFQQAKNKAGQIKILAQLNLCRTDEIISILQEGGIQVGSRTKGALLQKEMLDRVEEQPSETIPEAVPADWKSSLKVLTERITELKQIRDNAEKELSEIYKAVGSLCGKE